jgi:hypothetical protein
VPMRNEFQIEDTLQSIAPAGMCGECIGDRLPLSDRRLAHALIDDLQPPQFKRVTGECIACRQVKQLIQHGKGWRW